MNLLKTMLQDGIDGSLSSKRVITFLSFILCSIAFISNLFYGLKVEAYMFEGMIYLTMAGLGVVVAEKFSSRQSDTNIQTRSKINNSTPLPPMKEKQL